jgi:leader peptidase (prepilin peptidase)/N-methyltransferase
MAPPVVALIAVGLLGLAAGSFLNVVIYRLPRAESLVRPGSRCPHCAVAIKPWHNLPVLSWLILQGRCVHCGARISLRYPAVESGTALLFVAVTVRFGLTPILPAYLYLAAVAVALALIDLDVQRLPNRIVLPSYVVGGVLLGAAAGAGHDGWAAARGLVAMAALWLVYFGLSLTYRGGMGFGDVKLAGLLGLYLGFIGWGPVWIGALAGFAIGGLIGVGLLVTRRATRRSAVPFGPAMLGGALLAVFLGGPIGTWYAGLLGPHVG